MCVSAVGTSKCVRGSALSAVSRSLVECGAVISGGNRWRRCGLRACGNCHLLIVVYEVYLQQNKKKGGSRG